MMMWTMEGEVNRVGIVTDVDLGVVSKTLVARGLVSYSSGALRGGTLDLLSDLRSLKVVGELDAQKHICVTQ